MSVALQRSSTSLRRFLTRCNQSTSQLPNISNVKGLSDNVLQVPKGDVGPGASKAKDYKNPEYFCYNNTSYFEAEVEMHKFRIPQPSNKK